MLLVIFCLIRPIYSLFAKADFPDASGVHVGAMSRSRAREGCWTRGMTMAQAVPRVKGKKSRARGEQR